MGLRSDHAAPWDSQGRSCTCHGSQRRLEEEGAGLRLSTITKDGDEDYTRIPCLAFADDVVLMAETAADMQQLMNICTEEASRDNFKFNAEKTQWLSFNTEGDQNFYLQNHVVKKTTSYKYLGVTITSDKDYLAQHERNILAKSNQLKGAVWHLARHSYNKYSVGRILWKTLAVPAVTYANDALTYSAAGIKGLDRHQYELGRWLLGGSSCTANTAVTGEMGWSTHQNREARSKLQYMGRLKFLPEKNYARRMYYHIRYKGTRTNWIKKLKDIDTKYSGDTNRQQATTEREWARTIRKEVTQAGIQQWQRAIQRKQSLELYRRHKSEPAPYHRYRGDRASALLFQARTGCLLTQSRKCELYGEDPTCRLCGEENETIEHVVNRCRSLEHTRKNSPTDSLERALGLTDADDPDDGAQRETEDTGRRLVMWERLCRNTKT
ncbi:hypothetical protein HPB47_003046 [Ixodes persulcatus]|uniref:Uncharacterized protein n=1 Tax=Ixodes persulcatus TaxID=34615 RepID=A0AC60PJJ8_IXOPE|nr:hypothetical protein HPB47_003046 [Ixodes persulcatus]